jgi:hypothetical protein
MSLETLQKKKSYQNYIEYYRRTKSRGAGRWFTELAREGADFHGNPPLIRTHRR